MERVGDKRLNLQYNMRLYQIFATADSDKVDPKEIVLRDYNQSKKLHELKLEIKKGITDLIECNGKQRRVNLFSVI